MVAERIPDIESKSIRRDLRRAASDSRYLDTQWDKLMKTHNGKWVAVYEKEILIASNLEELFKKASAKGWDLGTVVVEQLQNKRAAALL